MFFNRTASKLSVASASTLHEKSVRAIWEYAASGIRTSPPGYDLTSMDSSTCIKLGTVAQAIAKKAPTCPTMTDVFHREPPPRRASAKASDGFSGFDPTILCFRPGWLGAQNDDGFRALFRNLERRL